MHYDAGVFHKINTYTDTRLSFYYIDVENYIVANSGDSHHAAGSYGYNLDQVIFFGVEAEFNAALTDKLTLFGNYSYRKTEYDEEKILADAILLELAPEHKANLCIRYRLFPKTLWTSDIRYTGERKTEGAIYTLDAFITVDAGVEYELFENVKLRGYIVNLFGEAYEEVYGYPMPAQVFGVNLKMTLF
ncbi:MAG: TonB-dependent receptor [Desulfatitalea sp.]|nr:TonB-dependent receptor [Desulfatitalea sp.]NNK02626.1 TonB-dependent receptor [Desulfatitalea sp.]